MIGVTPRVRLPAPHPGQIYVRQTAGRFNWLSAGRRWRKTTLAMTIVVEAAVTGGTYIWAAPTYDQVRIGFSESRQALGRHAAFNLSRMTAVLPGGGEVVYRSIDTPDNVRGHTADGVVIDEAGFCKAAAWHEVLRPMLIDTGGWAWGIGTPNGRNWFYREWFSAQDNDDVMAWQVPTLGVRVEGGQLVRDPHPLENPHVPFDEVEKLWRTMPERVFQQEILAQFVESSGGVFRRVREAATAERQDRPIPGHEYAFGVDWGQQHDFTAIAVMDLNDRALVHLDRFRQIDYVVQAGRLRALYERFKPVTVIAEQNSMGQPIIDRLVRDGIHVQPFMTTNASKMAAIDALALAFERGDISIIDDPVLIGELQAYEMSKTQTGLRKFSAPDGMHDDTVIALALAWQAASKPPAAGAMVSDIDMSVYKTKRRKSIWNN